jgi:hopanoid biosynthesis associated RND transporter like protein HpnN
MRVSTIGRLLGRLVGLAAGRPIWTLVLSCLLAAAGAGYALTALTLKTSQRALLPQRQPSIERYAEYTREFGDLDDIAVVVEASSLAEAKDYVSRLASELRARQVPLKRIAYRIDPKQFEGRGLLYLPAERLGEIRDKIFDSQELMEAFAGRPTLDTLVEGISAQVASGFAAGFLDLGLSGSRGAVDLRFIQDLVGQIAGQLDRPTPYRSPFGALFSVGVGDEDGGGAGYFLSDDQRLLFILVEPISRKGSFTDDREAIEGIRATIAALVGRFPGVQVGVTGKPALANDEMTAAFRDSERATALAFVLILALLLVAFMRVGKPILMLAVLAVSLGWSIGAATLLVGHLSLFSVMFIPIVAGVGIDYGIYFLFRYEEELFLGRTLREALEVAAARSGPGMLLAAVAAAGTFYVLTLTDFRGLQELGLIAGTALLCAWVAMMTTFPALLALVDRRRGRAGAPAISPAMRLEGLRVSYVDLIARHPRTVLAVAGVATALSLWGFRHVQFDYNLLNLQAPGTESVAWERRILAKAGRSGVTALASASSLEELRRKRDAFARLPSVSEVDSALLLIPDDQPRKLEIIRSFADLVGPLRIGRPLPVDTGRLVEALASLERRLGIAASEAPEGDAKRTLATTTLEITGLIRTLRRMEPEASAPILQHFQTQVYEDFVQKFQRLQGSLNPTPMGIDDLPAELRRKFVSDRGRFLLHIHPAVDIWEREGARRFVGELRGVDAEVTGTPVITYEVVALMERAYTQGTLYAIVLVSGFAFAMLRRVRETALALVPLALGLVWTGGLMALFRLDLTMGNIFGLPLILGVAVEYGLNVVIRYGEGRHDATAPLVGRSTIMGVLVNGLANIAGFGSLMLADHRGIFGLGLLITLGVASSLAAALVVLPVLLQLIRPRQHRAPAPDDAPAGRRGRSRPRTSNSGHWSARLPGAGGSPLAPPAASPRAYARSSQTRCMSMRPAGTIWKPFTYFWKVLSSLTWTRTATGASSTMALTASS